MKKIMHKKENGITLVALVITIIVLIILAAVSINAVMNDGLVKNAKEAAGKYGQKSVEEQLELAKLEGMLVAETLPIVQAGGYTGTENKRYVEGGKTAIIPAGFTVSNIEGETSISKGLVIYSGDQSGADWVEGKDASENVLQNSHNQYVWIPVDNPSDIYGTVTSSTSGIKGKIFGKLYDFNASTGVATPLNWPTETGYSASSNREPAVLNGTGLYFGYDLKTKDSSLNLDTEFNDMIASVEKYKGFYIGRYETSDMRSNKKLADT